MFTPCPFVDVLYHFSEHMGNDIQCWKLVARELKTVTSDHMKAEVTFDLLNTVELIFLPQRWGQSSQPH